MRKTAQEASNELREYRKLLMEDPSTSQLDTGAFLEKAMLLFTEMEQPEVNNCVIPVVICRDIHKHLSIIENYLKGEHNHETNTIQQKEDWELYQETIRLKDELSNHGI